MTAYDDVPQVSMLYAESEMVNSAIAMIDAGATLTNFTIGPPRVVMTPASIDPSSTPSWPTAFSDIPTGAPIMPININVPEPPQDQLMIDLRAWLVQRETDIQAQLTALGVTTPPPVGKSKQAYGSMRLPSA